LSRTEILATSAPPAGDAVFGRILCGVDGTEPGLEAVRQAARVLAPDGSLVLAAVCEAPLAVHGGTHAAEAVDDLS
jgi:hypothetical protein